MYITNENGGYFVEIFRRVGGGWNWRAYKSMQARTNPKIVPNAVYSTRKAAIDSAKDWVSQQ